MPRRDFTPAPGRHAAQIRFLAALAGGAKPPAAAADAGVSLKTLYTWRRRNASFRQAWKKARARARATWFPPPPRLAPAAGPDAAPPPGKTLTVVLRSFTPGAPNRLIRMERQADGRMATVGRWDEPQAPEETARLEAQTRDWEARLRATRETDG